MRQRSSQLHHPVAARAGFTLLEIMIVVAIVGILAMFAVPAYNDSVRKSRRAEAFTALAAVQQSQERWRGGNAEYSTSLSELRVAETTPNGYYAIGVSAPAEADGTLANGYIAVATAAEGTTQAADEQCATLAVRMLGGTLSYAGCGSGCSSFAFSESHTCWAR